VFKVEHNLTDPAEYPYDKQYENKLNKVQTRSLLPTVTVDKLITNIIYEEHKLTNSICTQNLCKAP
jgi:hypothetical protein